MKNKKSLGRLFYNNKFVLVLSIFLAFILWVVMAMTDTEKYPYVIREVPVDLKLSDAAQMEQLQVFSTSAKTVSVKVTGNSLIVRALTPEDIKVTSPDLQSITTPGYKDIKLQVTNSKGYEATVSPSTIRVYVDYQATKTFDVSPDFAENGIKYSLKEGYYMSSPTFSAGKVTVSGPKSVVSTIATVTVRCDAGELEGNKSFSQRDVVLLDANGEVVQDDNHLLTISPDKLDVTFPVQPRKLLPLKAEFTGLPSGLVLTPSMITIEPSEIDVAAPASSFENVASISLAPKSFSSVRPETDQKFQFEAEVQLPEGFKNIGTVTKALVTIDLSSFTAKTIEVKNFKVVNSAEGYSVNVVTSSLMVTVVGPQAELDALTEENIVGVVDLSGKQKFVGYAETPVSISLSGTNVCWVYGEYKVSVNSKK